MSYFIFFIFIYLYIEQPFDEQLIKLEKISKKKTESEKV